MTRTAARLAIPAFSLYGETPAAHVEMLHIEAIQARSRHHRWEIAPHTHRGLHQILWVAAGPAEVALEGAREQCHGPVAVVIPAGVMHAFRFSGDTDGHVLTFNARALIDGEPPRTGRALGALFAAGGTLHFDAAPEVARRLGAVMNQLHEEFASPEGAGSPVPLWLARAVVWRLARHGERQVRAAPGPARDAQALFTRFLGLLEEHHCEHWPVSRYANRLGLTPERLNRLARDEAGQSALELIHERLAREACRRLTYVAAPISRLAFELGFEDPAYFCRFFKRRIGQGPREYRRAMAAIAEG
jgi:AraC family transcriptional activator of pobA